MTLKDAPLGKTTDYVQIYTPKLLYPVPRSLAREKIEVGAELPFTGFDIWNGYELSWLNLNGKPEVACAEFRFPCDTVSVIESKSFKLYLNSFNQSFFDSFETVKETLIEDLSGAAGGVVEVKLIPLSKMNGQMWLEFSGTCLDDLDISTETYEVNPEFLETHDRDVEETVYSNLLKSNCLATGQPDWGSVLIRYSGKQINHEGLLKYIVSYRNHSGFAEHCVEHLYRDIMQECRPDKLTVYIRYTRRGGLDINPFRSNFEQSIENQHMIRQ